MNRSSLNASAIRESLDGAVPATVPPPPPVEPGEFAYDLPGDRSVTWAELGLGVLPEETILALALKDPHSWTFEEECAATDLLAATPEPLSRPYINLLFACGDAEEVRLFRLGATFADLDD